MGLTLPPSVDLLQEVILPQPYRAKESWLYILSSFLSLKKSIKHRSIVSFIDRVFYRFILFN